MERIVFSDDRGRRIVLESEAWQHIVEGHPEMEGLADAVAEAVRRPTCHRAGQRRGEEWFYLEGVGPSRFIKVAVAFDQDGNGLVKTAFPRRRFP